MYEQVNEDWKKSNYYMLRVPKFSYFGERPEALPRYHTDKTGYIIADLWKLYDNNEIGTLAKLGYYRCDDPPNYSENNLRWDWENGVYVFNNGETMDFTAHEIEVRWNKIRAERDFLLRETDWTQCLDIPEEMQKEWALYRRRLRDLSTDVHMDDPWAVVMPERPYRHQPEHYLSPERYHDMQIPYV